MVDWTRPLRTKSGAIGVLQESVPHETRRRVLMCRDGSYPSGDATEMTRPGKEVTTWLYPDSGIARCDGVPSDQDLVNA